LAFLDGFEKEASSDEIKMLIGAFQGFFSISGNIQKASEIMAKVKTFVESHKDVDSYLFSSYYRLCYTYYAAKGKYKLFYTSALQYLAYTQPQEIEEQERLSLLFDMAVAVLVSDEIYNFSELLEQPLLVELKNSHNSWLYELIEIFNKGDIAGFSQATLNHVNQSSFRKF
jgi:26S proteasome regulatory subunit N9